MRLSSEASQTRHSTLRHTSAHREVVSLAVRQRRASGDGVQIEGSEQTTAQRISGVLDGVIVPLESRRPS